MTWTTVRMTMGTAFCLVCRFTITIACSLLLVSQSFAHESRVVWTSQFDQVLVELAGAENIWGRNNLSYHDDASIGRSILRVFIPAGSIDPASMSKNGLPRGGAGFKQRVMISGVTTATLTYRVRFANDFDFVRGGKLPGLFGGKGNSGGDIPNGTEGFSFRLMWGAHGSGSVYAYLPTSVNYGTNLLKGNFKFTPGRWHTIRQEVVLNHPSRADGLVRMWFDHQFVGVASGLLIRTVDSLKINGLFFDVFFGGNDSSWASSKDTYIDFADFEIRVVNEQ